jgi:intraflagellar transport protein 140
VLNADSVGINMAADKISSIVYDNRGRSLVAGTREGRLMFWKNMALGTDSPVDKDQWAPQPILNLGKQIQTLTVGKNNGVIVCKQSDGEVIIVSETKISARMSGNFKAILKGTDKIEVSYEDSKDKFVEQFTTSGHIKGFDLIADKLLYWTSKKIEILEIVKSSNLTITTVSSIEQKALRCLFASKDSFIISTDYGFNLLSLMGQIKQSLTFPESEGKVSGIEITNNFLVCWTQESYMRVFTIAG